MSRPNSRPSVKARLLAEVERRFRAFLAPDGITPALYAPNLKAIRVEPYTGPYTGTKPCLTIDAERTDRQIIAEGGGTLIESQFTLGIYIDDVAPSRAEMFQDGESWLAWIETILFDEQGAEEGHRLRDLCAQIQPGDTEVAPASDGTGNFTAYALHTVTFYTHLGNPYQIASDS